MPTAWISMGSNLGDRGANLLAATAKLSALPGVSDVVRSALRETPAEVLPGAAPQRAYLNAAARLRFAGAGEALLHAMQGIEGELGRPACEAREVWAPRTVDLDLLFLARSAGWVVSDAPELLLPHPRWARRRFVLLPLLDLDPAFRAPDGSDRPARELLAEALA